MRQIAQGRREAWCWRVREAIGGRYEASHVPAGEEASQCGGPSELGRVRDDGGRVGVEGQVRGGVASRRDQLVAEMAPAGRRGVRQGVLGFTWQIVEEPPVVWLTTRGRVVQGQFGACGVELDLVPGACGCAG